MPSPYCHTAMPSIWWRSAHPSCPSRWCCGSWLRRRVGYGCCLHLICWCCLHILCWRNRFHRIRCGRCCRRRSLRPFFDVDLDVVVCTCSTALISEMHVKVQRAIAAISRASAEVHAVSAAERSPCSSSSLLYPMSLRFFAALSVPPSASTACACQHRSDEAGFSNMRQHQYSRGALLTEVAAAVVSAQDPELHASAEPARQAMTSECPMHASKCETW